MAHIPAALAQLGKLHSNACDISFGTREPGLIPEHTHPTHNHGVVTEGCLYLGINGEERAYHSGDWFQVPAHTPHSERFEQTTSVIVFWLPAE